MSVHVATADKSLTMFSAFTALSLACEDVRRLGIDELCAALEGENETRDIRIAAGLILALVGDPRIRPMDPQMVEVPGGKVVIGLENGRAELALALVRSSGGDRRSWTDKEMPAHAVMLKPYRIGKFPVTNAEFGAFVAARAYPPPAAWLAGTFPPATANAPVASITPNAADAYVRWLCEETGRRFRLPTEAEWENAAAGPDRTEFPWGDSFEPDRANTVEAGLRTTTPVGAFARGRSFCGAFDMAGNVEEFVADCYAPYPGGVLVADDLYRDLGAYRIARGGSYGLLHDMARCRRRHGGVHPRYTNAAFGFRLAEDIA